MTLEELILEQIEYEHWANVKVIDACKAAGPVPERVWELISHVLQAKRLWLDRIEGAESSAKPWNIIPPEKLAGAEEVNYEMWKKWHEGHYKEKEDASFEVRGAKGRAVFQIRAVLIQLTHHAAYHRGQIVQLLKQSGAEVPQTDYLVYAREKNNAN